MEGSFLFKMDEVSVKNARKVVEEMMIERAVKGRDISFLSTDQKVAFAKQVQSVFRGNREGALKVKSNGSVDRGAGQPPRLLGRTGSSLD